MKTTYPKKVRHVHSEYLNNSFLIAVLFLIVISITALALTGCGNRTGIRQEISKNKMQTAPGMQLSTGNRFSGPQLETLK